MKPLHATAHLRSLYFDNIDLWLLRLGGHAAVLQSTPRTAACKSGCFNPSSSSEGLMRLAVCGYICLRVRWRESLTALLRVSSCVRLRLRGGVRQWDVLGAATWWEAIHAGRVKIWYFKSFDCF